MRKHARTRRAASLVLGLSLALTVLVVAPANAADPTLTASLTPTSANAGAKTPSTLKVSSNQGTLQTLTLNAPSNFNVDLTSVVLSSGTLSGTSTPTKIVIGGLKIAGSDELSVSFDAYPACTSNTYTWTLTGIQKGGAAYAPLPPFTTTVPSISATNPSSCKLVFQPIADQLSEAAFPLPAQAAFPVSVDVVRQNDTVDPTFAGQVSLTIETDPGTVDAKLTDRSTPPPATDPPTEAVVNGVATFSVSLDKSGTGYKLEACSPTINSACDPLTGNGGRFLSGAFAVYDAKKDCQQGNSCFANASALNQVATQVTVNGQNGKSVKAGIFSVPQSLPGSLGNLSLLDCAGYDEITEVIASFDFNGDGTKTVVNTVSAEQMKEIANNGVSYLQTCFGSSLPFTDRFNNPAVFDPTLGLFVGLLKDCATNKKNPVAPCIVSRQGGGAGTGLITYIAADKDPGGARH